MLSPRKLIIFFIFLIQYTSGFGWSELTHLYIAHKTGSEYGMSQNALYYFLLGSVACDLDKSDAFLTILAKKTNKNEPVQDTNTLHNELLIKKFLQATDGRPELFFFYYGMLNHFQADFYADSATRDIVHKNRPNSNYEELLIDANLFSKEYPAEILKKFLKEKSLTNKLLWEPVISAHKEFFGLTSFEKKAYDKQIENYNNFLGQFLFLLPAIDKYAEKKEAEAVKNTPFYRKELEIINYSPVILVNKLVEDQDFIENESQYEELLAKNPEAPVLGIGPEDITFTEAEEGCFIAASERDNCLKIFLILFALFLSPLRFSGLTRKQKK